MKKKSWLTLLLSSFFLCFVNAFTTFCRNLKSVYLRYWNIVKVKFIHRYTPIYWARFDYSTLVFGTWNERKKNICFYAHSTQQLRRKKSFHSLSPLFSRRVQKIQQKLESICNAPSSTSNLNLFQNVTEVKIKTFLKGLEWLDKGIKFRVKFFWIMTAAPRV